MLLGTSAPNQVEESYSRRSAHREEPQKSNGAGSVRAVRQTSLVPYRHAHSKQRAGLVFAVEILAVFSVRRSCGKCLLSKGNLFDRFRIPKFMLVCVAGMEALGRQQKCCRYAAVGYHDEITHVATNQRAA